jgi:hypothetical protein
MNREKITPKVISYNKKSKRWEITTSGKREVYYEIDERGVVWGIPDKYGDFPEWLFKLSAKLVPDGVFSDLCKKKEEGDRKL